MILVNLTLNKNKSYLNKGSLKNAPLPVCKTYRKTVKLLIYLIKSTILKYQLNF